jgi:CMP-N-acetylneuraminic acid synthetase
VKTVAWVPIKLNNQRLPGKNTKPLGGKPLCRHMLDTLTTVNGLDDIIVFCSDEAIVPYLPNGVRFLRRSAEFDRFDTKADAILDALTAAVDADIYVNAHVTNPFIKAATIKDGIAKVKSGEFESAHVVSSIQNHLWYKGKPFNFNIKNIPRTQDLEPMYEDAGLFVYRKEVWTKGRSRYSENPYFMICGKLEALDIDYPEDFKLAEAVYNAFMKGAADNE